MSSLAGCGPSSVPAPSPSRRPNIVLISVDTLRPDHLGAYGYRRPTSPHIDSLARRGMVFDNAVSTAPWTLPAHISLLTGRYPAFHGVQDDGTTLAPSIPTLAEYLEARGYTTLAVVSHVYVSSEFGLENGFDLFDDSLIDGGARNPVASDVIDRFLQILDARPAGETDAAAPFFAFLHLFDPHWDYTPPAPFATRFTDPTYRGPVDGTLATLEPFFPPKVPIRKADRNQMIGLYDGEIAYVDDQIGRLLTALDERDDLEGTVIVFTADHGEEFKEHGQLGHGKSLFEEQIHIPLILAGSPAFDAGSRRAEVVSLIDVAPTLLALAGAAPLPRIQGRSLLAPGPAHDVVYAGTMRFGLDMRMARRGDHKLIQQLAGDRHLFFDLSADPGERHPLRADPSTGSLASDLAEFTSLADRGWHLKLVAWPGSPVTCRATVTTTGRLVRVRRTFWNLGRFPGSQVARFADFTVREAETSLTFDVSVSELFGEVRFDTVPPDAPVTFELTLDRTDRPAAIYLADGSPLPEGRPVRLDPADDRLAAFPGPLRSTPAGVHIRHVRSPTGPHATLSEAARRRLRALGYTD